MKLIFINCQKYTLTPCRLSNLTSTCNYIHFCIVSTVLSITDPSLTSTGHIWHWPKISNIYPCYLGIFLGQNISISTRKCTKLSGNCPFFTYLGLVSYKYFDKYVKKYFLGSHIRYQNMPKCWKMLKIWNLLNFSNILTNYFFVIQSCYVHYEKAIQDLHKTPQTLIIVKNILCLPADCQIVTVQPNLNLN